MPTVYLGPHIADMRESLVIMCSAHQIEKGKQSFIIMGYPEKGKAIIVRLDTPKKRGLK